MELRPVQANLQDPVTKKFTVGPASSVVILVVWESALRYSTVFFCVQRRFFFYRTVNKDTILSVSDDSTVPCHLRLVEEVQMNRSATEKLTKLCTIYTCQYCCNSNVIYTSL